MSPAERFMVWCMVALAGTLLVALVCALFDQVRTWWRWRQLLRRLK